MYGPTIIHQQDASLKIVPNGRVGAGFVGLEHGPP